MNANTNRGGQPGESAAQERGHKRGAIVFWLGQAPRGITTTKFPEAARLAALATIRRAIERRSA